MRFEIDAERLWDWYPSMATPLAELGGKEMNTDYV